MQTRLKDRLQNWKNRCLSKTIDKKKQSGYTKRLEARILKLESDLSACEEQLLPTKIPYHTYPAQLIALAVFIVVYGNGSLRCAAKTVGFLATMMGWDYGTPSHVTIRNWVLRCGYYALEKGEEKIGEYVGIIDESIEIGGEKLLLLLGLKLQKHKSFCAPLQMTDMEVLGMEVQKSWTGDAVSEFVESRQKRHGKMKFRYIISDGGSALLNALRQLSLSNVRDCTHIMMNIAKKLFSKDVELSKFCAQVGQLRQSLCLTKLACLLPPTLRDKDRFVRVFTLTDWYRRIMLHWDNLPTEAQQKFDFLFDFKDLIERMEQIRSLIAISSKLLKSAGISEQSILLWEERIKEYSEKNKLTIEAEYFITAIRQYLQKHITLANKYGRLLCCSDIIESSFGRYKNKNQVKVISADVLKIALYAKNINTNFVYQALCNTSQNDIQKWQLNHTCDNKFSIIHRMNRELKSVPSST